MIEKSRILFEDNHLLIVNKKVSELVQADKTGDKTLTETLKEYIKNKYQKQGNVFLEAAHRLDRPTSGIVVFARTSKADTRMKQIFREREVEKKYWAVVKKADFSKEGTLTSYLKKNPKNNKSIVFSRETEGAKKAILHYKEIFALKDYSLLEVNLETGRHHQIRAQLSKMGSPIRGDIKYGFDRTNPSKGINLHAREISFIHPVKKEKMNFKARVPIDDRIWELINDEYIKKSTDD